MGLLQTKRIKLLAAGVLLAVPLLGWMGTAQAQSFRSGDHTVVAFDETVDSTVFAAGNTVDIAGTVNGDVFCGGQNINISGTVNGDVICAGQTVRVSGKVSGDVRAAGQTVAISGEVGGNLSAVGQNLSLEADGQVKGDVSLAGQLITINGGVGRDLALGSGDATINSTVGRNVTGSVEQLTLGSRAAIEGDLTYTSRNEVNRQGGAQVAGEVRRDQAAANQDSGSNWLFSLWFFLAMLTLALVLVLLLPRVFQSASAAGFQSPGRTLLIGVIASIVVPVLIIGSMLTIVGIPLGLLAILAWIIVCVISGPFTAFWFGRLLLRNRSDNAIWMMLAGSAALLIIYMVPIIGWIVMLLAFWFGIGMILSQAHKLPKRTYQVPAIPAKPGDQAAVKVKPVASASRSKDKD